MEDKYDIYIHYY